MVTISDAETLRRLEAIARNKGNVAAAARELGLEENNLHKWVKSPARSKPQDPAIEAAMEEIGTQMIPRLVWVKTKNEEGVSHSVLLKPLEESPEDLAARVCKIMTNLAPADPVAAPAMVDSDLCTVYPLADVHIGMMAWGQETGEDYDTGIAASRVRDWVGRAVDASPASGLAIILDVGDLTHANDQTNQTQRSKHILDVDTRNFRTLDVTIATLVYSVEYALRKHARVKVRILPGNHNPDSYLVVMFALAERYRDETRVEIQKVPGEFFMHEFGRVMIAAHHGDKSKADRMVHFIADQYAEAWGRTRHRYLFTGHLHHHKSQDIGGVTWEQLRAVTARDAYAASHAYVARAQLQGITLHRDRGEVQRVKVGL